MGILHGISRFLRRCKTEDEESEKPLLLHPTLHWRRNDDDSLKFSKILSFHSLIYIHAALKGLCKKVFCLLRPTADSILPIQNPAPSISNVPLIWRHDSSADLSQQSAYTTFAPLALLFNTRDGQELQCDNVDDTVFPQQTNSSVTRKEMEEHAVLSIPEFTYSFATSDEIIGSAVVIKECMPAPESVSDRRKRIGMEPSPGVKGREEGQVMINCTVALTEERWIKHYSTSHRILLVGEGDFSFSTCLAAAFGLASHMVATSLDSQVFLVKNYHNALPNIVELSIRKCKVMHEIDATKMANHVFLGGIKFDRIVFNFPFAGFFKNLPRDSQLRRHRRLVSKFLMNAKEMLSENGEIHITHKTNVFHMEWKLESVASSHKLRLIEAVDFTHLEYPGYNTKCGFGGDNNFNCYPSKTYKFGPKC